MDKFLLVHGVLTNNVGLWFPRRSLAKPGPTHFSVFGWHSQVCLSMFFYSLRKSSCHSERSEESLSHNSQLLLCIVYFTFNIFHSLLLPSSFILHPSGFILSTISSSLDRCR